MIQSTLNNSENWQRTINSIESFSNTIDFKISENEYQTFKKHWVLLALSGKRFGQAFCEHFKLPSTSVLYQFKDQTIAERWIQQNFIE